MDHLGQTPEPPSPSVQLHDHSMLDYGAEDKMKALKYRVLWSNVIDRVILRNKIDKAAIDHLGQSSEGFSPSVQLHDHGMVDHRLEDKIKTSKYQGTWSNIIDKVILRNRIKKSPRYHEVAVLLLCWDQGFSHLNTQEEVDTLKAVFEDQFGYSATIFKLSSLGGLQVELNKQVAIFVSDHDRPHNLLIVYYAGHGRLELLGFVMQIGTS